MSTAAAVSSDILTLSFSGTQVDVIYIQHPALGSFAVEIDGTVVQTVTTTAADTVFGAKVSITGLAAGAHTLRIVPVSGTIAIDAFAVELPLVTPTEVPTEVVPTAVPTEIPTEVVPPTDSHPNGTADRRTTHSHAHPAAADSRIRGGSDPARRQWTSYPTDLASGGSYLYSSGSLSDTLTLTFSGSQVDVIYVQHPALGMFALEVDGAVNQIVNATAADTVFGVRATISVPAGQHTLRILPISGTIAIDAFALDAQATVIMPAVEPTPILPTAIPPTSTPEPTLAPLPVILPAAFSFDALSGWTGRHGHSIRQDTAVLGVFVSSATRGQVATP